MSVGDVPKCTYCGQYMFANPGPHWCGPMSAIKAHEFYYPRQLPLGNVSVPAIPTEEMWGGLARDIVMWTRWNTGGSALFQHLTNLGREIPGWLREEIQDNGHVPPKGTIACCIYRAMIEAAPHD